MSDQDSFSLKGILQKEPNESKQHRDHITISLLFGEILTEAPKIFPTFIG